MKRKLFFLTLAAVCLMSRVTLPQDTEDNLSEVKVEALVNKSQITIGEEVTYTIRIDAQDNWQVEFPGYIDNLGGFVVSDFGSSEPKRSGKNRYRKEAWYVLDTYTTGSYVIPPLSLKAKGPQATEVNLETPQIFVEVKSVVKDGEIVGDIRDIKRPLGLKANYRRVVYIAIAVFACFFILLGLRWWIIKNKKESVPAPTPAHLVALEELEHIQAMNLIEKKRYKEYHYLVSMCLRRYLENRFNLKAPEQTTEEFLEEIVKSDILASRQKTLLGDFLMHCDLVKFARYTPSADETSNIYTIAKEFVGQTKEGNV